MKKVLTLRNVIVWAGALLLLVAFFLSFGAKMSIIMDGVQFSYNGIVWGSNSVTMGGVTVPVSKMEIGVDKLLPSGALLVGVILMLVASIAAVVIGLLVKKPWAKWVVLGCAAVAITGAIMQFVAKDSFAHAYVNTLMKAEGITDKAAIDEAFKQFRYSMDQYGAKVTLPIVSGVLGLIGALAIGGAQFLPEKELLK